MGDYKYLIWAAITAVLLIADYYWISMAQSLPFQVKYKGMRRYGLRTFKNFYARAWLGAMAWVDGISIYKIEYCSFTCSSKEIIVHLPTKDGNKVDVHFKKNILGDWERKEIIFKGEVIR